MAISRVSLGVIAMLALVFAIALPSVQAQSLAPGPASVSDDTEPQLTGSAGLTSGSREIAIPGTTIDQGIACVLMLVALVLTYLIHTLDAPLNF